MLVLLALLSSCASNGESNDDAPLDGQPPDTVGSYAPSDASVSQNPASTGSTSGPSTSSSAASSSPSGSSGSTNSSGASSRDAGTSSSSSSRDAASASGQNDIDDLLGGLFGDSDGGARPASSDGGSSGEWKLESSSDPECPPEPPPIPIIGGPCLGLYYICDWKNAAGETYTCTCDWVHWLCV